MDDTREEDTSPGITTLDKWTRAVLSHAIQVIRTTLSRLQTPGISPLAALDANAVDALKELYYTVNTEDPLNAMPARRVVLEQRVVRSTLLPLINAVHADPAAETNQKRWRVPMYQTLRLLSVLSIPISSENDAVKPGSSLDTHLLKLRADLAQDRHAVHAFVLLLQYYIERKADMQAGLATAEESKLEDARIDNILRFFRNILSPPRAKVGEDIFARDRGVHLGLVGALVSADFYSTLALIFSSPEDAHSQYTDIVFLVADIYAHTYRHTSPSQLYQCYRQNLKGKQRSTVAWQGDTDVTKKPVSESVFANEKQSSPTRLGPSKNLTKPHSGSRNASRIRSALQRERVVIGGSRAITTSARWSSRHSGGFLIRSKPKLNSENAESNSSLAVNVTDETFGDGSGSRNISVKRVVSARNAIRSKLSLNPMHHIQEDFKINSDILCLLAAKGRSKTMKPHARKSKLSEVMRRDLQEDGLSGIVALTTEVIDVCFGHFVTELRSRIEETKTRTIGDENEALLRAQKAFLAIVGSVVGFQREKYGKVFKSNLHPDRSLSAEVHENCMKSVLESDFKIAKNEWRSVEAGIELESFQLVFRTLVDSCVAVKTSGKDQKKIETVETSTFAVLEMMKMLQGMAANDDDRTDEVDLRDGDQVMDDIRNKKESLTARETALNTLEQLFEDPDFLNAPADLAKDYGSKMFSFKHLTNIVEITHAFTTILLNEKELAHLQVSKKKKKKKKKATENVDLNGKHNIDDKGIQEKDSANEEGVLPSPPLDGDRKENTAGSTLHPSDIDTRGDKEKVDNASDHAPAVSCDKVLREEENGGEKRAGQPDEDAEPDHNFGSQEDSHQSEGVGENESRQEDRDGNQGPEAGGGDSSGEADDSFGPELREVESVGIIRKFAQAKAIETLLLPIRAAICKSSSLSGCTYSIPDGAGPLLSNIVIAKAAHCIAAVWKVAKQREKGALCGQFFTFATMQLMSTVLNTMEKGAVREQSVLERFSVLSREVTQTFFSWLMLSPGLALDMFFVLDKGSCQTYATSIGHRKAMLEEQQEEADSGNETDISALGIEPRPGNIDFERMEKRASSRREKKDRSTRRLRQSMDETRRPERVRIEEDEDVDDIDNLDIGGGLESSEGENSDTSNPKEHLLGKSRAEPKQVVHSDHGHNSEECGQLPKPKSFCRLSKGKKKRIEKFDPFASDDEEVLAGKTRKKRAEKIKKDKKGGESQEFQAEKKRTFDSSDEYSEVAGISSDSDVPGLISGVGLAGANETQYISRRKQDRRQDVKRRRLVMSDSESK